ncbi:hypothetical protein ILYODFUR_037509 [Ilyodon furcidens]|uniref:Uncharacterized protein n=1 Tax=Ilyodon furcidens TaxID=33524 RepID=A0ABV0VL21_9TELE
MLDLDAGRTVLCMVQFVLEKLTLLNFCWTLGQKEPAEMRTGRLLLICQHQTVQFDLLCREKVRGLCLSSVVSAFAVVLGDLVFTEPPASSFLTASRTSSFTIDTSV